MEFSISCTMSALINMDLRLSILNMYYLESVTNYLSWQKHTIGLAFTIGELLTDSYQ